MKSYYNCDKLNDDLEVSQLSTQPQYLAPFSVHDFPEDQTLVPGATILIGDDTPKMPMCFTNIVYDDRQPGLVLDILVPPVYIPETGVNDQRQFPLIIWIQGSAFATQEIGLHLPHLVDIAQQGYVVAAVAYQGSDKGGTFPSTIQDVNTAIDFLVAHAKDYHIDPDQLVLWGESSGAYTAIMTAATQNDAAFFKTAPKSRTFQAVIDFYGPTRLQDLDLAPSIQEHRSADSWVGAYFGHHAIDPTADIMQQADPVTHLHAGLPPFLIFHGTLDMIVPFQQSVLLKKALDAVNVPNQFVTMQGSNHGTDAFWSPAAKAIVLAFLADHTTKAPTLPVTV